MSAIPAILLGLVLIGSWVFCILAVVAARSYRKVKPPRAGTGEPISILKPLHGLDDGLEQNLRTFFEQNYPNFEILFAAREDSDAGLALARRLSAEYPGVPARFFVTGEPPYPNAKVWSLEIMTREARHDLLVMADSDIRTTPEMLETISDEFASGRVGVATCPYRAIPGPSFWSTLEAIGMDTEFWAGAFTARYVERGVRFAIGPTAAARRTVLDSIGGWPRLSQYLAEDFVMGQFAAEAGHGVILSSFVVEHRIGAQPWRANFNHRLRWNRSTRRSRPAGYVGQLFTNPIPLALLLVVASPQLWPALVPTALLRAWTAYAVAGSILRSRLCASRWYLIPVQDLLSFAFWIAGFFGYTIEWRGRRYLLRADGRFERAS
jgi:ceramide glucosyltransferase